MNLTHYFLWLITALLLTSCYETGKITRRFTKIDSATTAEQKAQLSYISVDGIALNIDTPQVAPKVAKNVFTLSDHGQEAYINSLASIDKDSKKLQSDLPNSLDPPDKNAPVTNTKFTKRLLFSIRDATPFEADRITRISITIPLQVTGTIHITNIAGLQTEYASINTGTVSLSNALTLGLSGSIGYTGGKTNSTTNTDYGTSTNSSGVSNTSGGSSTPTAGVSANVANTRTFGESVTLNNRYVVLSFSVVGTNLTIYEESVSGVNLIGNVFADVTFETENPTSKSFLTFGELFKGRTPVSVDSLPIDYSFVVDPSIEKDLVIPYQCEARVRHVKQHYRTTLESDDVISYAEGTVVTGKELKILTIKENVSKDFDIEDSVKQAYDRLMICDNITKQSTIMHFNDYYQALNFYKWLIRLKTKIKFLVTIKD